MYLFIKYVYLISKYMYFFGKYNGVECKTTTLSHYKRVNYNRSQVIAMHCTYIVQDRLVVPYLGSLQGTVYRP